MGGYLREHERPPAFRGVDGESYTVEILVERAALEDGAAWGGYLFFLRWCDAEAVGHVETRFLSRGASEAEARAALECMTLHEVKELLDTLVA